MHFKTLKGKHVLLHNGYVLHACMWSRRVSDPLLKHLNDFFISTRKVRSYCYPIKIIFINMLLSTCGGKPQVELIESAAIINISLIRGIIRKNTQSIDLLSCCPPTQTHAFAKRL